MVVTWLLLSWAGPSALVYGALRALTVWKPGLSAAISGLIPPAGTILCVLATLLLSLVFPSGFPNSMWLLVPGTLATVVLTLLLRSLGVRTGTWPQWALLLAALFGASVLPLFTAAALGAQSLQPGW